MEAPVKCPWCEKEAAPVLKALKKANGSVKERRCTECGKVLAAYLDGEGDFIKEILKFEN
jgi:phage FluMu protein Com